ncbi:TonB-dependent receptor [Sphingobacterium sp. SRCM116780]|uniref:TonB-dependent receptor n=1 Tax=Sphingobacterium sp. SRCM116780 TaxID=2907623 RepID=UPI001F320D22|nr:TonB-dependent receptor [Sphingobacterium sp. SRCM116780]UIR56928.1 TonB-dependent receptor [Sphingobacterium sp. SRCM116780]
MFVFKSVFFCLLFLCTSSLYAQEIKKDTLSSYQLETAKVSGYLTEQALLTTANSVSVVGQQAINSQNNSSFLPGLNTVPGLRMEERSPGSYRLALRGSLIRSPFGIRNVKVYMDEFPITDAGGNTYLNIIDPASISQIEVLKGPDGSIFGSNSGGVLVMKPNGFQKIDKSKTSINLAGGSFGFAQQQLSTVQQVNPKYRFSFDQSFTRTDGYRENSALNKKTFQTAHQWNYIPQAKLKLFAVYSDLYYQTPGGLTFAQYQDNPRASRPATATTASAKEQKAEINNKTFFAGLSHNIQISKKLNNTTTIFGSSTKIENPVINNYEYRDEKNLGYRSYFSYVSEDPLNWQVQIGTEGQKGWYDIANYDNNKGTPGSPQAKDKLENWQNFYFVRTKVMIVKKWTIEGAIGLNQNQIAYKQVYPVLSNNKEQIKFGTAWMPKIASSYLITTNLAVRASISSGFSPPTIAEIRSSDNVINTGLRPESGKNKEIGLRWEWMNRRIIGDFSYYQYNMDNAIIRQLNADGVEFYQNAGKIKQKGIESAIMGYIITPNPLHIVRSLYINSSITYNDYRFSAYQVGDKNYSHNKLTAVPDWIIVHRINLELPHQLGLYIQHNFTSKIPLNDANTDFSAAYQLLQAKLNWGFQFSTQLHAHIYMGIDNITNEKYSLGNDINAFGSRYYNASPTRNFFAGLKLTY